MRKKIIRFVCAFFLVMIIGIVYVVLATEGILNFLTFRENSGVIHAILYATGAICATLILTHGKE